MSLSTDTSATEYKFLSCSSLHMIVRSAYSVMDEKGQAPLQIQQCELAREKSQDEAFSLYSQYSSLCIVSGHTIKLTADRNKIKSNGITLIKLQHDFYVALA